MGEDKFEPWWRKGEYAAMNLKPRPWLKDDREPNDPVPPSPRAQLYVAAAPAQEPDPILSAAKDIEFAARSVPSWRRKRDQRAEMAKKIREFLDVPTHGPCFVRRPTEAERALAKYNEQVRALGVHVNCVRVMLMIQAGLIA